MESTGKAWRESIEVDGFDHDNPIPAACRVGSMLMSSAISGKELYTGKLPESLEAQCANMWSNVRKVLEAAGAKPGDVIKMNVWMKDRSQRSLMNKGWLEMFPHEHSRPARHTFHAPDLPGNMLVQCELTAVLP
jgi:enamine deaminase RidA (YjgF/YER057c/UK114 family)